MLPPSTTGASPAASTAAASELVVVLPFVPVTPTVAAGHSRRNRSTSLTTGTRPAASTSARAARRRGSVVGKWLLTEGDVQISAWPSSTSRGSSDGPSSRRGERSPSASMVSTRASAGRVS